LGVLDNYVVLDIESYVDINDFRLSSYF